MELLKKLFHEAQRDRLTAEAAKAAYYFFLSFFPTILALFALTGILGGDAAFDWIMSQLYAAMPGDAANYLSRFVLEVTGESRPGLLSLALLFTVWAASNVFVAIADGLNVMYDLEEGRSWWKRRVIALVALLVSLILLSAATAALVAGPELISLLRLEPFWHMLRWPVAFVMLTLMMWLIPQPGAGTILAPHPDRSPRRLGPVGARNAGLPALRRELRELRPDVRLRRRDHRPAALAVRDRHRHSFRRRGSRHSGAEDGPGRP